MSVVKSISDQTRALTTIQEREEVARADVV